MRNRSGSVLLSSLLVLNCASAFAFDFEDVARKARQLAQKSYQEPDRKVPAALANLTYDQYRDIRFRPDKALWHGTRLPFEVQFLHPGLYYDRPVVVNLVTGEGVRALPFKGSDFDYGRTGIDPATAKIPGFAGLRIHYPLNAADYKDEVLVFQGASYFRALAARSRYGLSARGLAVDTGELTGEEFPQFTEFWIEWPRPQDHQLTIHALLDSPRMTGAYRFQLRPGAETVTDVKARLYFRDDVAKLGLAPLTSMYLFGENQPAAAEDYRPEVHDSDGLLIHSDREWIWRPLVNPRRLLITSFGMENPRGFGLMQRDRQFARYEDLEARYELRPSAWIEPRGSWGKGRVELVLIPTPDETNDNVVAYWVPDQVPGAGESLDVEYSLRWQLHPPGPPPLAQVAQTRRGHGWMREPDASLRFHIDFEGGELPSLPAAITPTAGVWIGDSGQVMEKQLYRNDVTGGWRLSLRVRRADESQPLEMRAVLRGGDNKALSETWSYVLPASAGR